MHDGSHAETVIGRIDFCNPLRSSDSREGTDRPLIAQGQVCLIGGWILGATTARRVEVIVDGRTIGLAETGLSREDVAQALQRPDTEPCGISALIATADLSVGDHMLTIEMVESSGRRFRIDGPPLVVSIGEFQPHTSARALGNVDEIRMNDAGDTVFVRGWIADARTRRPGAVAALVVDGEAIVATYGIRRDDVAQQLGEGMLLSGFVGQFSLSARRSTDAVITVGLVSSDGRSFDRLENFVLDQKTMSD